jgi:hypothetical protein
MSYSKSNREMCTSYTTPPLPSVRDLDVILLLPFGIKPISKALTAARHDVSKPPSLWLGQVADQFASGHDEQGWKHLRDPFHEKFGFPDLYSTDQKRFAEFTYFHPFIQRILYSRPDDGPRMAVLARKDICQLALTLNDKTSLKAAVRRAQMFIFTTDLAVLAVQLHVSGEQLALAADNRSTLAPAYDFLDQVRRIYTPYWKEGDSPGQTPLTARWLDKDGSQIGAAGDYRCLSQVEETIQDREPPLMAHWQSLIEPWNDQPAPIVFQQLGDERCYAMVYLSLDRPQDLPEQLHYRLAFLDSWGAGWAYNPSFLAAQDNSIFYDRFWCTPEGMTTRFMSTGYSFAILRDDDPDAGYLHDHFQNHYFFLNLLALMQKSSLLITWDRLSVVLKNYANADPSRREDFHWEQKWLREDLADYLALFEFSQVSNQLQALELFEMIRKNLDCGRLFDEVMCQIEFACNVEQTNYEETMQDNALRLTDRQIQLSQIANHLSEIANRWLPLSLALMFLGMSIALDDLNYWVRNLPYAPWIRHVFAFLVLPAAVWAVFSLLFKWWPSKAAHQPR